MEMSQYQLSLPTNRCSSSPKHIERCSQVTPIKSILIESYLRECSRLYLRPKLPLSP